MAAFMEASSWILRARERLTGSRPRECAAMPGVSRPGSDGARLREREGTETIEVGDGVEQPHPPGGGVVDDGERRVLPALRRLLAVGQDQVPAGERATDEAVRDDGEVSLGRGGRLLHERPGPIDASVEDRPAFPVRRRV